MISINRGELTINQKNAEAAQRFYQKPQDMGGREIEFGKESLC